jgi:DnaJ like chaperone protein
MEFLKTPKAALILALVYFVFPLDLIPDIFGPFGRFDDLIIFGLAIWRVLRDRNERAKEQHHSKTADQRGSDHQPDAMRAERVRDPHTLFKLSPGASQAEIDARYKELAKDYHPDRVAHLGEDLRKVAHEKMIEIQQAYDALSKNASVR